MDPGCQVAAICTTIKNQHWAKQVQSIAKNFPKFTLGGNPGTNYKPWLPSGSNLHSHQKSTLGLNDSRHVQAFS